MLIQELLKLYEERQKGWTYAEKRAKVPKGAPTDAVGAIEKVVLSLEGNDSAAVTRLAKRYDRLDISAKLLKDRRDALNANMKMLGDTLFDAEDALVTRIVETASYTVMLTASEKGADKPKKEVVDYEAAYKALAELVPELTEQAKAILAKYTEMIQAKDTPMALKVKPKAISEGLVEVAKRAWRAFVATVTAWGKSYDKKLDAIQTKYPVGRVVTEAKEPAKYEYTLIVKDGAGKVLDTKKIVGHYAEDDLEGFLGDMMDELPDAVETAVKKKKLN